MPIDITFTLSDHDLERFRDIVDRARTSVEDDQTARQVEQAAQQLIDEVNRSDLPDFISSRVNELKVMLDMIRDEEWQLSEEERRSVLSALMYFCDTDDLIPDHIPGLGFLDDAIYVQIVIEELDNEIRYYKEFCAYRDAEEKRRSSAGEDIKVGREEWLHAKRSSLHASMRKRRAATGGRRGWRLRHI